MRVKACRLSRSAHTIAGVSLLLLAVSACSDNNSITSPPTFNPVSVVTQDQLKAALERAVGVSAGDPVPDGNGGLNLNMWATVVDTAGVVVAVVYTGSKEGDQWQGSRIISAQKANTAMNFSLDAAYTGFAGLALSTANLYSATQPGGSLFGLQDANPINEDVAYGGNIANYGTSSDYMIGKRIGGTNVFGGGFALYDAAGNLVGAVGVSGDTSCADQGGDLHDHRLGPGHAPRSDRCGRRAPSRGTVGAPRRAPSARLRPPDSRRAERGAPRLRRGHWARER